MKALKIISGLLVSLFGVIGLFFTYYTTNRFVYDDYLTFEYNVMDLIDNRPFAIMMFFAVIIAVILNFIFVMVKVKKRINLAQVLIPGILLVIAYFTFMMNAIDEVEYNISFWQYESESSAHWPFIIMVLLFAAHIVFSRLGNKQIQPRVLESQEEVHAEPVQTTRLEAQQPAQPSVTDELVQYKKLLDAGIITQEEFDAKKKQILGL